MGKSFIEILNRRHAVVMIGGKAAILNETVDPIFDTPDVDFSTVADFKTRYKPEKVEVKGENGESKMMPIADVWLASRDRRYFEGLIFDPKQNHNGFYNLWRGFAVEPKPGKWNLFQDHIYENICGGNIQHTEWVLAWMARPIQDPGGARPGTSIALKGEPGTGKGILANTYGKIFGAHYVHASNQRHVTGRFNSQLKNCVVLFMDESLWAGDKTAEGTLKALITEPEQIIEAKYINPIRVKNFVNIIMASNSSWVVPVIDQERRFLVLDVSDKHRKDYDYFAKIIEQMETAVLRA